MSRTCLMILPDKPTMVRGPILVTPPMPWLWPSCPTCHKRTQQQEAVLCDEQALSEAETRESAYSSTRENRRDGCQAQDRSATKVKAIVSTALLACHLCTQVVE